MYLQQVFVQLLDQFLVNLMQHLFPLGLIRIGLPVLTHVLEEFIDDFALGLWRHGYALVLAEQPRGVGRGPLTNELAHILVMIDHIRSFHARTGYDFLYLLQLFLVPLVAYPAVNVSALISQSLILVA